VTNAEFSSPLSLGRRQCIGTSDTVHLQCAFGLFDILAYIRNYGRAAVCRKILQGECRMAIEPLN
jgi:hypothetical protein